LVPGSVLVTDLDVIDFGGAIIGQTFTRPLRVRNAGDTEAAGFGAMLEGLQKEAFGIDASACGGSLEPGGECVVDVTFTADTLEPRSATAALSASGAPERRVLLSGAGIVAGSLTPERTQVDFETREVGVNSEALQWAVSNTGGSSTGPLTLANGDPVTFMTRTNCGPPLAPGASCVVSAQFVGQRRAATSTLVTVTDGSNTAQTQLSVVAVPRLIIQISGAGRVQITTEPAVPCESGCRLLASRGVTMLATPTNGASSYFTGWTSSDTEAPGCSGSVRECRATIDTNQTITANFGDLENNLIFVSSETFSPDLGGTAPYDAACNRLATAAGINDASGTGYIAALSGSEAFSARVPANVRGWIRMDGMPVADALAGLFATQTAGPFYPVLLDELGQSHTSFEYAMTGTGDDGSVANNCDNWTPGSADSTHLMSPTRVIWGALGGSCDRAAALLCMGVTKTTPLVAQTYTGKRMWSTATALTVGEQNPDAFCQASRPTGVASAAALIAYTSRPAIDRLDPAATYVRPDGALVGTGTELRAGGLKTALRVANDGSTSTLGVWTGGPLAQVPNLDDTCGDWSDPTLSGSFGDPTEAGTPAFFVNTALDCTRPSLLYCFEL
jgi:hypothetical protein